MTATRKSARGRTPKRSSGKRGYKHAPRRGQALPTEKQVKKVLDSVIDPHTNQSVVRMNLVYVTGLTRNEVSVIWRPTSPTCPLGLQLSKSIQDTLKDMDGVKRAKVKIVGHVHEDYINKLLDDTS